MRERLRSVEIEHTTTNRKPANPSIVGGRRISRAIGGLRAAANRIIAKIGMSTKFVKPGSTSTTSLKKRITTSRTSEPSTSSEPGPSAWLGLELGVCRERRRRLDHQWPQLHGRG